MVKDYTKYLYFKGEIENPFTDEQDLQLNRHIWWHYERHYHFDREDQKRFSNIEDFIIWILDNKVDYGDREGKLYSQYKNSSPTIS